MVSPGVAAPTPSLFSAAIRASRRPSPRSRFSRYSAATAAIVVFTVFMVGRNALHAVKIKRQINLLTREQAYYTEKIGQDSALLERLKYDDYLEEYARENYRMQRRNEHVYIMKE